VDFLVTFESALSLSAAVVDRIEVMLFNLVIACLISTSVGFNGHVRFTKNPFAKNSIRMVATAPPEKKLQKVELIKLNSNYLVSPLQEELGNDEIFVSPDAVVVLKYHGSYMQDDRDKRAKGVDKSYQFMLRLKSPCGEIPPELYKKLDNLADTYGQGDLRITTRQAWQLHGIMKGDLKTVISTIMEAGSSTVGACGDVSRNVMCSPAPFVAPAYQYARQYSKVMAELFKPQSQAFTSLWQGEEKVAEMEYWMKDLKDAGFNIQADMLKDTGHGIITTDPVEPLYGNRYLPRKFKMAVTVPGDNSLDIYINDVGLVVITDDKGELLGFNVMVGGGMGRTHNKDSTFARVADHFGFVAKEDVMELCKSILAAQRDHGNRDVRPNARMKYLVHTLGIDAFRTLVEVSASLYRIDNHVAVPLMTIYLSDVLRQESGALEGDRRVEVQ
jgi:sulfite reductase (ferredoxin)